VVVLRWRRTATVRFTQVDLLDKVAPTRPRWRRHVVAVSMLFGLALAVVATARPVDRSTENVTSEGRILVLFDVSLSMMADDVDPDRFVAAQEAARTFVDEVDDGVEVGLVSFSGLVTVEVDPTLDRSAMQRGIDNLELDESTAIGEALAAGARLLVNSADPDADPDQAPGVMVLLSDGETTVGRPTADGALAASEAGIPVYTIAFGTEGGVIADPQSGDLLPVPVRPDDLALVAQTTGARRSRPAPATSWRRPTIRSPSRSARRSASPSRSCPSSPGSGRWPRSSCSAPRGRSASGGYAAWSERLWSDSAHLPVRTRPRRAPTDVRAARGVARWW
jgi:Ca-activated chloride channel homolog